MGLFDTLYGDCQGYLELRAMRDKKVKNREFFILSDTKRIKSWVAMLGKQHDLYFAIATRNGKTGKGTKEDIVNVPAVFLDIDFNKVDEGSAIAKLDAFPLQPTIRVMSGGGLHVYWCLKEPADREDIPQLETIMRGLCMRLDGDRNATDASRILRIPNSTNFKYKPPKQVILQHCNGTRYNLSDFDDFMDVPVDLPRSTSIQVNNEELNRVMACPFMRFCEEEAAHLGYEQWLAMISQLMHLRGGRALIHKLSKPYSGYKAKETDDKINNAQDTLVGPYTCEVIRAKCGYDCGVHCGVRAPAGLAYRQGSFESDTNDTNDTNDTFEEPDTKRYKTDTNDDTSLVHPELGESDKVRKWLDLTDGVFHYTDAARDLQLKSTKNLRNILTRLCRENVVERIGSMSGTYQRVDSHFTPTTLFGTSVSEYKCVLPLDLSEIVKVQPGNLIVVAGDSNAAKTWTLLEFCRLNLNTHKIRYINSEMSDEELNSRLCCYDGRMDLGDWRKVEFGRIEKNYHHHIVPDAVTIIDFIDIHSDFYRMGEIFKSIHEKLGKGICIVAIQKKMGVPVGKGGEVTKEKARLYVSLNLVKRVGTYPFIIASLEKVKISRDMRYRAEGSVRSFEVNPDDATCTTLDHWHRPSKEEYKMMATGMCDGKRTIVY